MLKDFYIPRLSNDMKITVQKNNLRGQIWYRSLDPVKKTASSQLIYPRQYIHFAYDCVKMSTVQHEFMHAISFVHEQTNYYRDEFIFVNETVIEALDTRGIHNYQKVPKKAMARIPYSE